MSMQRELHHDADRPIVQPLFSRGDDTRPGPAAAPLDFAALHGQIDIRPSRIAAHEPDLGAEHTANRLGELIGVGGPAGAPNGDLFRKQLIESLDAGAFPDYAG